MTRFALIDHYSGYIYGVTDAKSAVDACRTVDAEIGGADDREYEEAYPSEMASNVGGYHVHEVPAGWDCEDGQDEKMIAEVSAMPRVASFVYTDPHA